MDHFPLQLKTKLSLKDLNANIVLQIVWHCWQLKDALLHTATTDKLILQMKDTLMNYMLGKSCINSNEIVNTFLDNGCTSIYFEDMLIDIIGMLFPLDSKGEMTSGLDKVGPIKSCLIQYTEKDEQSHFLPVLHICEEEFKQAINSYSDISQLDKSRTFVTDYISLNPNFNYCSSYFPDLIFLSTYTPCDDLALRFCLICSLPISISPVKLFKGKCPSSNLFYTLKGIVCEESFCPVSYFKIEGSWVQYKYSTTTKLSSTVKLMEHLVLSNAIPTFAIYEKSATEVPEMTHDEFNTIYEFSNERYNVVSEGNKEGKEDKPKQAEEAKQEKVENKEIVEPQEIQEASKDKPTDSPVGLIQLKPTNLEKEEKEAVFAGEKACAECDNELITEEEKSMLLCNKCIKESMNVEQKAETLQDDKKPLSWKCKKCSKTNMVMKYTCECNGVIRL